MMAMASVLRVPQKMSMLYLLLKNFFLTPHDCRDPPLSQPETVLY